LRRPWSLEPAWLAFRGVDAREAGYFHAPLHLEVLQGDSGGVDEVGEEGEVARAVKARTVYILSKESLQIVSVRFFKGFDIPFPPLTGGMATACRRR
jgi:hypothetical protein